MSVETKGGGVTTLSALTIDADKNWAGKGISNLKELAAGMATGDLLVRNLTKLERLQPGPIGTGLTSGGPLHVPSWQPFPVAGNYYLPVPIMSTNSVAVVPVDRSIAKNASITRVLKYASVDAPADFIKRIDATLASTKSVAVMVPDQSITKTAQPLSGLSLIVDGFVEETAAAVQTDHTAEAQSGAAGDLNLNPMSDTVLDKVYIGSNFKFWQAQTQVGTVGAGNWTNVWYYWNGAWTTVVDENDGSSSWFHAPAGLKLISHTPQADWALHNILGLNLYWLMCRTDNYVNRITKPLGSQIWVAIGDH